MPIPRAKATAPPMVASGIPAATPPNNTPTARPSGILCIVMADTSKVVLCQGDLTPSFSLSLKLMCKCESTLSKPYKNNAPNPNPMAEGMTLTKPSPGLIAIPGANKLQKLAATITPPVKPSIPSRKPRFMPLKKKTSEAPRAVKPQVKSEA